MRNRTARKGRFCSHREEERSSLPANCDQKRGNRVVFLTIGAIATHPRSAERAESVRSDQRERAEGGEEKKTMLDVNAPRKKKGVSP